MPSLTRFPSLASTISPSIQREINRGREFVDQAIPNLTAARDQIRDDVDLSASGQASRLRQVFSAISEKIGDAFLPARQEVERERNKASGEHAQRMWSGVDERRLPDAIGSLRALIAQHADGKPPFVDGKGAPVLPTGPAALRLLDGLVREGPLDDARLVTMAVLRADPIVRALVGGQPTADALLNILGQRVEQADAIAAKARSAMNDADDLLALIAGDERTARTAAATYLNLPKEIALRPAHDPVRELASRKA
jgi:hypothetical protein